MPAVREIPVVCTHDAGRSAAAGVLVGHHGAARGEKCPLVRAERHLDAEVAEPAGTPTDEVRLIDDIEQPVLALLRELTAR